MTPTGVEVGARFRGRNQHDAFGDWETVCEVVEVEEPAPLGVERHRPRRRRRDLGVRGRTASDGVLIRQWGRMGPDRPG